MAQLLFVYGTLRTGFEANRRFLGGVAPISTTSTRDATFTMCTDQRKAYPFVYVGGASRIAGELYSVTESQLSALDDYEGEQYSRIRVFLDSGHEANVYVSSNPQVQQVALSSGTMILIPNGDWVQFLASEK